MKPVRWLCAALLGLLCFSPSGAQRQSGWESTGPIARSGGVEVEEIHVERRRVAGAVRRADLTYMTVRLWFSSEPRRQDAGGDSAAYLVRLLHLEPVADDTGRLLSCRQRLADLEALQREVVGRVYRQAGEGAGPVTALRLDAPARGASKIKLLRGKAEVITGRYQEVTVEGLVGRSGKRLVGDPLLRGMRIEPVVKFAEGSTAVTLNITGEYNRLLQWEVRSKGRALRPASAGHHARDGAREVSLSFRGAVPKDSELRLTVVVPEKKRSYEFRFSDLELP